MIKLKRILAGITACAIVSMTMLAMPISARTTTKVEEVTLSDLLNTAKMVADLKDDLTAEKQEKILDKFDTDGSGHISIGELLEVAKRVARIDESDIVNEYGKADKVPLNPTFTIGGTEYKDGDTFIAKANEIYEIGVSDAENEITVSLTGSKDDEDNDLVRVNENNFTAVKDGTLTITVKSADGQEMTITLNIVTEKPLADVDALKLKIKYSYANGNRYSDEYKEFSNIIERDIFNNRTIKNPDEYWENIKTYYNINFSGNSIIMVGVGHKIQLEGFQIKNDNGKLEDYNTTDEVTYISTNANKVTVDENGVITGVEATDNKYKMDEIIVMANKKEITRFRVYVKNTKFPVIETSDEYAFDYGKFEEYIEKYKYLTEGKYVENASQGKVMSLRDLQSQIGAENVRSVSLKNFDGTKLDIKSIDEETLKDVIYYADITSSTVYYAITSETGEGRFDIKTADSTITVKVLDMDKSKIVNTLEALTFEFRGDRHVATMNDGIKDIGEKYFFTEGEVFDYLSTVKVNGVENPEITLTDSWSGTSGRQFDYDPLMKVLKAREISEESTGVTLNGRNEITLSYTGSDGIKRGVKFEVYVGKPIVAVNPKDFGYADDYSFIIKIPSPLPPPLDNNIIVTKITIPANMREGLPSSLSNSGAIKFEDFINMDGKKIYVSKDMDKNGILECIKKSVAMAPLNDEDGVYRMVKDRNITSTEDAVVGIVPWLFCKFSVDNEKMLTVDNNAERYNYDTIKWTDGYEFKAGDTVTITATNMANNPDTKTSFTLEIVDALPNVVKNGTGADTFKYPKNDKGNQYITFGNAIDITNLPDGCEVIPYVESASSNVCYTDEKGEKRNNNSEMTVDTSGIKIIKGTNGHYSISGIEVAVASKVDPQTFMNVRFKVVDTYGNVIKISDPIKLFVKGEQTFAVIIGNKSKEIEAGETADLGTILIEEGEAIKFSTTGTCKEVLTNETSGDNVTIDTYSGLIKANKLNASISKGNTEGKEISLTYGTGEKARTAKAKVVVVKVDFWAYYKASDKTFNITDGTFWKADGNTLEAEFVTEVDSNGTTTKSKKIQEYTTVDGKAVFKCPYDETTASCKIADISKLADTIQSQTFDKNTTEVKISANVPEGLSMGVAKESTRNDIRVILSETPGYEIVRKVDATNVSGSASIYMEVFFVDENNDKILAMKKPITITFTETSLKLDIDGKTAKTDSSNPQSIPGTIYLAEGQSIDYTPTCMNAGEDETAPIVEVSSNDKSLVTCADGKITAGELTSENSADNNTTVTFKYQAGDQIRTITAKVVVVKTRVMANYPIEDKTVEITNGTFWKAGKNTFYAEFITKLDSEGNPEDFKTVTNYTTGVGGATEFKCPYDEKITASCTVKEVGRIAENQTFEKSRTEVTIPINTPDGLRTATISYNETKLNKAKIIGKSYPKGAIKLNVDASNVSDSETLSMSIEIVEGNITVDKQTVEVTFAEIALSIDIKGFNASAISSKPEAIDTTIYIEQGTSIDYKTDVVSPEEKPNVTVSLKLEEREFTHIRENDVSPITIENGQIKADKLTLNNCFHTTVATFEYKYGEETRTITAKIVVVIPTAVAPVYDAEFDNATDDGKKMFEVENINITDDVYYYTDESKKAVPALVVREIDNIHGEIPDIYMIKDGFKEISKSEDGKTITYELQGIEVSVTNEKKDPSTLATRNNNKLWIINEDMNATEFVFDSPWDLNDVPSGWYWRARKKGDKTEWTAEFDNNGKIKFTKQTAKKLKVNTALTAELMLWDKNGHVPYWDKLTFNIYTVPTDIMECILIGRYPGNKNKVFMVKTNTAWKIMNAEIVDGEPGCKVVGANVYYQSEDFSIVYDNPISEEKNVKVKLKLQYDDNEDATIEKEYTIKVTPV